ncbi:MAG: hypothetical protein ABIR18_08225, partial [Chitinophagaceae bacterium]
MKKLSLVTIITLFALSSFAQSGREEKREKKEAKRQKINEMVRQAEEGVLVYEKQSIFGIQLRSNGYGAFYELGRMKTNRKTNIYRIDITEIKDHKEEKLLGGGFLFGNPFIYGKRYFFYPITLGFGQQYMLGQKGNKNGVAVSAVYNAGLAIGVLRPYYVDVQGSSNQEQSIKYSQDSAKFVNGPFLGASGLGKGWSEARGRYGGFVKAAMRFDYGR